MTNAELTALVVAVAGALIMVLLTVLGVLTGKWMSRTEAKVDRHDLALAILPTQLDGILGRLGAVELLQRDLSGWASRVPSHAFRLRESQRREPQLTAPAPVSEGIGADDEEPT